MNDKEKQIEELHRAKAIEEMTSDMDYDCTKRDLYPDDAKEIAKALYLLGYRKLPEDSVVLSREEYEMLVNQYRALEIKYSNLSDNYRLCKDANETLKQNVIIARKQTAKEILDMGHKLYEMSYYKSNAMPRLIEWMKVEYRVKVEE